MIKFKSFHTFIMFIFAAACSSSSSFSKYERNVASVSENLSGMKGVYSHEQISKLYGGLNSDLDRKGVSKLQKSFFEEYMSTGTHSFRFLNRYLRNDRKEEFNDVFAMEDGKDYPLNFVADEMLKVFNKHQGKFPKDLILFRGVDFSYLDHVYPKVGEYVSDKSFMSTSISPDVALKFGDDSSYGQKTSPALLIMYNNPAHFEKVNGLYIRSENDNGDTAEGEVLMRPKSRFKVVRAQKVAKNETASINVMILKYCGQDSKICEVSEDKITPKHVDAVWEKTLKSFN